MTPIMKLVIALAINVGIALFTILSTRRSSLPDSTKTLLYVIAVLMPIIGLILYGILSRKEVRNS